MAVSLPAAYMNRDIFNKTTEAKDERSRRIELGMLDLLIDRYPAEAAQKLEKKKLDKTRQLPVNSLALPGSRVK